MPLFDLFWSMLWFFLWILWIWLVITIFIDIFRSDDLSGWGRAGWAVFVVFLPWLGVLVYVIARGNSMQARAMQQAADRDAAARSYIQSAATPSNADELEKLAALRDKGVLTPDEFTAQKAKLLA